MFYPHFCYSIKSWKSFSQYKKEVLGLVEAYLGGFILDKGWFVNYVKILKLIQHLSNTIWNHL